MKRKKFSSEPAYGNKYLKIQLKSYNNKIKAKLYGKASKEGTDCVCLSAIVIDCVFKLGKINICRRCEKNASIKQKKL